MKKLIWILLSILLLQSCLRGTSTIYNSEDVCIIEKIEVSAVANLNWYTVNCTGNSEGFTFRDFSDKFQVEDTIKFKK